MALGPKAMGEAIAANLKAKTGKTLEEWLALLDTQELEGKDATIAWLKVQGLGHFQAQLVFDKKNGEPLYDNPEKLIEELFAGYEGQKSLYEQTIHGLQGEFTVNPCKGYIPLYSADNRIFASFKPTKKGLYVGLIGSGYDNEVEHMASFGGSERMKKGVYVESVDAAKAAIEKSYNINAKGV